MVDVSSVVAPLIAVIVMGRITDDDQMVAGHVLQPAPVLISSIALGMLCKEEKRDARLFWAMSSARYCFKSSLYSSTHFCHDVLRFQVAMDYAFAVCSFQRAADLQNYLGGFFWRQLSLFGSVKYPKRKRREENDSADENANLRYHNINVWLSEKTRLGLAHDENVPARFSYRLQLTFLQRT